MERDPYAVVCGRRLKAARLAKGYPKRPAFVRLTRPVRNPEEVRRETDNLRKWENGEALVPAEYVNHLRRVMGIFPNWVFSGTGDGMDPELVAKAIEIMEDETEPAD